MPKGFSYSQEEVDNFLDELEEIIPVTATAWERVAELHLSRYPDQQRSVDSLKRKFKELHNKKVPTGDPLCPPAVRRAKRIRYLIIDKMDASDLNEYNSEVGEDGTGEGEDDRSGDESASFLVRGGSVGSTGDDEAFVGLGLDVEDNGNEEEGRRSERSEGAGEGARQSGASVYSRPSSRASSVTGPSSQVSDAGSRKSSTRRRPQTHMTPISRPRTRQRGNTTPDSSPSDRIGNMIAMMMMNQASERDERRSEREERREEFRLQMEMQRQQMQQQQNMMTILLMNAMGGGGVNNQHQTGVQQLGMGILDNNNQQQGHGGEEGKTGGD